MLYQNKIGVACKNAQDTFNKKIEEQRLKQADNKIIVDNSAHTYISSRQQLAPQIAFKPNNSTANREVADTFDETVQEDDINTVINKAKSLIGTNHYSVGRCGGFIQKCYKAAGISIKNPAAVNAKIGKVIMKAASKSGPMLAWSDFEEKIKPGDILVKGEGGTWNIGNHYQSHVQLYIGGGKIIHSTSGGNGGVKNGVVAGKYYKIIRVIGE